MKIYIASRWRLAFRPTLLDFRSQLQAMGHAVTSRWIDVMRDYGEDEHLAVECLTDVGDVRRANWLIQVCPPEYGRSRGGNHVEFGMAMAWGHRLTVIGERQHVFHHLPQVDHYETIHEFLAAEGALVASDRGGES